MLYELTAAPPELVGAVQENDTIELPTTPRVSTGALGDVIGVAARSSEKRPSPTAFTAMTLK